MQISSSMMTHVRTFDVGAMKAQQNHSVLDRIGAAKAMSKPAQTEATPKPAQTEAERVAQAFDDLEKTLSQFKGIEDILSNLRAGRAMATEEARFADENGFTRQVNRRSIALYNTAKSGGLIPFSFKTKDDAKDYAAETVSRLHELAGIINGFGGGDPTVGGVWVDMFSKGDQARAPELKSLNDQMKDLLESSRMRLFVEAEMLSKSLGIDGPIYEVKDGKIRINAFDIEYDGQIIMRSIGEGQHGRISR